MSGSAKSTTTTDMGPWKPSQSALTGLIGQAQTLGGDTNLFKPTAGTQTQDAWQMAEDYARSGPNAAQQALTPVVQGSTQGFGSGLEALMSSANGNFLNPQSNPALMSFINGSNDIVANRVNQQFSGAGRYGGNGANTSALANQIGQNTNGIMMDQYNRERANQMGAANTLFGGGFQGANMAQSLDQANLGNATLLQQVGQQRDQFNTQNKQAGLNALDWQKNIIGGIGGLGQGGTQSTTTSQSNPMGTIMGGLMTAAGVLTGNPMMAMQGLGGMGGGMSSAAPYSMGYASPMQKA